tara:strand:+ start:402 stop:902 length:501 start_codon:yes stop_codon:yes gene_type:complete
MKTLFIQYHSGMRQVITDTTENLLDFLLMEIDNVEDAEIIEHIDKRNEVKATRERLGLTQQEFAEKIGVARETISKWENNHFVITEENKNKINRLAQSENGKIHRLEDCELSVRTENCLKNAGFDYLEDVYICVQSEGDAGLLKLKNFGRRSLNETKDILKEYGLV